jgi:hypothetical protein
MGSSAAHPGRPRGLPKSGGRKRGTPNKRSIGLRLGLLETGASPEEAMKRPLQFLLAVVADESQPIGTRIAAATSALPYTNHRLGLVDTTGRDVPLMVQVVRFSDGEQLSAPRPILDMGKLIEMDADEDGR